MEDSPKERRKITKRLTPKQKVFVETIKEESGDGLFTTDSVTRAALTAYSIEPSETHSAERIASTMGNQLLRKPHIQEALGLNVRVESKFFRNLENMIDGTHPIHPNDKDLFINGMKMLSRFYVPNKNEEKVTMDGYENRQDWELEYFLTHRMWPEQQGDPEKPQ